MLHGAVRGRVETTLTFYRASPTHIGIYRVRRILLWSFWPSYCVQNKNMKIFILIILIIAYVCSVLAFEKPYEG